MEPMSPSRSSTPDRSKATAVSGSQPASVNSWTAWASRPAATKMSRMPVAVKNWRRLTRTPMAKMA